jgi:hypothetical protein
VNHRGSIRLALLCAVVASLAGCAAPTVQATCDAGLAAVAPIERFDGMFYLTSDALARSVADCDGADDWMTALRAHPDVVSIDAISASDAEVYLASSCQLLPGQGDSVPACVEAKERGFFDEQ